MQAAFGIYKQGHVWATLGWRLMRLLRHWGGRMVNLVVAFSMTTSNFAGILAIQPPGGQLADDQQVNIQPKAASLLDDAAFLIYLPLVLRQANAETPPEPPAPEDEETFIIPAGGGALTALDGALHVTFPDDALQEDIRVRVRSAEHIQYRPDYLLNGWGFEIVAESMITGQPVTQFDASIALDVAYNATAWAGKDGGLTLFFYDQILSDWRPLPGYVDRQAHQIHATSDHLTVFSPDAQSWEASRLPSMQAFQVSDFSGAASYSFPIQVPPGPGGLQPAISLSYNSQAVDSASSQTQGAWLGMGWSLEMGAIQRNMNGTDDYLGDDTFSLNVAGVGSLLLPVVDPLAEAAGAEAYRLADESFWRIWRYPQSGNLGYPADNSYWIVWDKSGTQYRFDPGPFYPQYRTTIDPCQIEQLQRWQWPLTKITDKFGNTLDYSYRTESKVTRACESGRDQSYHTTAIYPERITYGNQRYHVEFVTDTLRTDYKASWLDVNSRRLFERSRLKTINIWHDPDGRWDTPNELIRKYELAYLQGAIFPNVGWQYQEGHADGKMHTLAAITEYGSDGVTYLPATTFSYDAMHLTQIDNGYGGSVEMSYQPWHADYDVTAYTDKTTRCDPPAWTEAVYEEIRPFGDIPGGYCTNLDGLRDSFQPGSVYKLRTHVIWVRESGGHGGADRYQVGLNSGAGGIAWGPITAIGTDQYDEFFLTLPAEASLFEPVYRCWKESDPNHSHTCALNELHVTTMLTRSRVTAQTSYASLTDQHSTISYQYGQAAVNDATHSQAVAVTVPDGYRFNAPYSEFRGHDAVTVTTPGGQTTTTWYGQDDYLAGKAWRSESRASDGRLIGESVSEYVTSYVTDTLQVDLGRFPRQENEPNRPENPPYDELHISWTHLVTETARNYQGEVGLFQGTQTRYVYEDPDEGFGNLLQTTTYEWRDSAWIAQLRSQSSIVSRVDGEYYLAGLPVLTQQVACGLDTCSELLSETRLFYDSYPVSPDQPGALTRGVLVRQRVLIDAGDSSSGDDNRYADTKYEYDAWGNPTQVTAYTGYGTSTAFASNGRRATITSYDPIYHTYALSIITGGDGEGGWKQLTTHTSYDYRLCAPVSETDPNGKTTTAEYDVLGRLTTVRRPSDATGLPSLELSYHAESGYFWSEARQNLDDSHQRVVRKIYTGLGQLVQVQQANVLLPEGVRDIVTDTFYDSSGRAIRQSIPYALAPQAGYHTPDTSQFATQTSYDTFGRAWQVIQPDGSTATTTISLLADAGRVYQQVTATDAEGNATTQWIDTFGRTTRVTPMIGPRLEYGYDPAGRLVQVDNIPAEGIPLSTTITYDLSGRKLAMDDPDMGVWRYEYDALGNLLQQTDALGTQIAFTYDGLGRIMFKDVHAANGIVSSGNVQYGYDEGGAEANALGRRTRMQDSTGTMTWLYDQNGLVISQTRTIPALDRAYTIGFEYNGAGQLMAITYPDGEVVTNTYNANGQPIGLLSSFGETLVSGAQYDAFARLTEMTFGNGLSTRYDYYAPNQQGGRLRTLRVGELPNPLLMMQYDYDHVGNIMQIVDYSASIGGQTLTFGYDDLYRLQAAQASGGGIDAYRQGFTYDEAGRLASRADNLTNETLSYVYEDSHPHAATQLGDDEYAYDTNGNMTLRVENGITYTQTWNSDNKLAKVAWIDAAGKTYETAFVYDGDGNRLMKIETFPGEDGSSEVTTITIGGIYEERLNTTALVLRGQVASWQVEELQVGKGPGMARPANPRKAAQKDGRIEKPAPTTRQPGTGQPDILPNGSGTLIGPYPYAGTLDVWCEMDGREPYSDPNQHIRMVITIAGQPYYCAAGRPASPNPAYTNHISIALPANTTATIAYQRIWYDGGIWDWTNYAGEAGLVPDREDNVRLYRSIDGITYERFWVETQSYVFFNDPTRSGLNKQRWSFIERVSTEPAVIEPGCGGVNNRCSNNGVTFFAAVFVQNDTIPPTTGASQSPTAWTSGNVVVTSSASDPNSGLADHYCRLITDATWTHSTTASCSRTATTNTTFEYYAIDQVGNRAVTRSLLVTNIDRIAPANPTTLHQITPGCTAPDGTWQNTCNDLNFTWSGATDTGGSGVAGYYSYWGPDAAATPTLSTTSPGYNPLAVSAGTYYLRVRTVDAVGNMSVPVTLFTLQYDNIVPSNPTSVNTDCIPAIVSGVWQNTCNDLNFNWAGATDAHSGVVGYDYYWGSIEATNPTTSITTNTYNPTPVASGIYFLRLRTRDRAGNISTPITLFTLRYDNYLPNNPVRPANPQCSSSVYDGVWQNTCSDPNFTWSGANDLYNGVTYSGVAGYRAYWGTNPDPNATPGGLTSTAGYNPPQVNSGVYYLHVRTRDNATNESSPTTLYVFRYDNQPPTNPISVTLGSGCAATSGNWQNRCNQPTFTWSGAADQANLSGLHSYEVYWGANPNSTNATAAVSDITYTVIQPAASGVPYFFRMRTRDHAGNWSAWQTTFTFLYDGTPPTIVNPLPLGYVRTNEPSVSANVSDAHSGLASGALVLDGVIVPVTMNTGVLSYTAFDLMPDAHYYTIVVTDTAGNRSQSGPHLFVVDSSTYIEILSPPDGVTLNQTVTRLELGLETRPGMLVTVTVGAQTFAATVNDGRWSIENLPLQPGANTITARASDPAGNTAADTHVLIVDPDADVALARAERPVANPLHAPLLFHVTALPGQGHILLGWQLMIANVNAQPVGILTGTLPISNSLATWDARGLNLPEGDYTYRLALTTDAGVTTSPLGALRLQTTAPDVPWLDCPSNPQWFSLPPAQASGTALAGTQAVIYINGTASMVAGVYDGNWQAVIPLTLGAPAFATVTVAAVDAAGNQSSLSAPCGFGLELRDPFTLPHATLSQDYIGLDDHILLTANTRRPGDGARVAWVNAVAHNQSLNLTESPAGTWTTTWHTPSSGTFEGIAIVHFTAEDNATPLPNHGEQFVQPYYDLVPPSIALTWPPDGHAQNGHTLSLQGSSEPLGDVAVTLAGVTLAHGTVSPLGAWSIPLTLPDGHQHLTVQATDRAGNPSATVSLNVLIDTTPPVVSIGALAPYTRSRDIVITWNGTDVLSGIASYDVQYRQNGGFWTTWLDRTPLIQATFYGNEGDTYAFRVRASDNLGNTSDWLTSTPVTVDTLPPLVTMSLERQNSTTYLVSWNGTDATSGVAGYTLQFRQNDGAWFTIYSNSLQAEWTLLGTFGSTYTVRLNAADHAGNTSDWISETISIASITKYYHFVGQKVAMRQCVAFRSCDTPMYLHGDHLGSVSLTTNNLGAVVSESRYLPFGEQRWASGVSETDFSFTGQREERGFGLADYNARFYSSRLGRFVSADTIVQDARAMDRYAYVLNNPLRYRDPSGHVVCDEDGFCYDKWKGIYRNPIRYGMPPKMPFKIDNILDFKDDPVELITRVILGEEGGKLFGPYEADAWGVAWAIRNRHDSGYYKRCKEPGKGCQQKYTVQELNSDEYISYEWYWAASSGVYGLASERALDPLNSGAWGTKEEALAAYNRAREIALAVMAADPAADITQGTGKWMEWADAYVPPGVTPEYEYVKMHNQGTALSCTNCIQRKRTRFRYLWEENGVRYYSKWLCVNSAQPCD